MSNESFPKSFPFKNPIVVALDVDDASRALQMARSLQRTVGGFKLGPRLCLRYGMKFAQEISQYGPLFMDNKHFDITSTMEAAVRASFESGASVVTVHALAGSDSLQRMSVIEKELAAIRPFRVLAVTILTNWNNKNLPSAMKEQPISSHVNSLADLALRSGIAGIVCSPHEVKERSGKGHFILTPGIRLPEDDHGDQSRVATPSMALESGANALVIGRPIVEAKDPQAAAEKFVQACYE